MNYSCRRNDEKYQRRDNTQSYPQVILRNPSKYVILFAFPFQLFRDKTNALQQTKAENPVQVIPN